MVELQEFQKFAITLAKRAGSIAIEKYDLRQRIIRRKWQTDITIVLDKRLDTLIRQSISRRYPEHAIISEETKAKSVTSPWRWVVDPLDGTSTYKSHTTHLFTVSIGLCYGATPVMGVIYAPARKELFTARTDTNATCNGLPIGVSRVSDINQAIVAIEFGKSSRQENLTFQHRLLAPDGARYTVTPGCATMGMMFVASGGFNAFFSLNLEPWDMAAAVVIARQAGAVVTDHEGKEWELGQGERSILIANPALHRKLLTLFW